MVIDTQEFCDSDGNVVTANIVHRFYDNGILLFKDTRFKEFLRELSIESDHPSSQHLANSLKQDLTAKEFEDILSRHPLAQSVMKSDLVVQDFASFREDIVDAYESVKSNFSGEITTYIPGLSSYDSNKWSASFCSTDGQVVALGDYKDKFTIQSVTKPILYGITSDALGNEKVHEYVGKEPSGFGFDKITLGYNDVPHNPLINIGAITVASLFHPDLPMSERFEAMYHKYKALADAFQAPNVSFNNVVYLSEKHNGHRNYAIGHYLLNKGCIDTASTGKLMEILELYFQLCSIELDTRAISIMGASLANGGKNVFTGNQVISVSNVQNMLSLMYSCGMYDYSGEWAFEIGLPAKSGVSGVIMIILPNIGSLALWSPLLDHYGNSVRGIEFTRNLLAKYKTRDNQSVLHPFSNHKTLHSAFREGGVNSHATAKSFLHPKREMHTAAGAWRGAAGARMWEGAHRVLGAARRCLR